MKELIGEVIKEIWVNEDQSFLKFVTDDKELLYYAEGDCCSESWFADILFSWQFFNKKVVDVEVLEVPDWLSHLIAKDGRTRQECDEVYGFQIKVQDANSYNSNWCDIIFRNSSNGYYGGWCEYIETPNKWLEDKLKEVVWTQIKEDWSA